MLDVRALGPGVPMSQRTADRPPDVLHASPARSRLVDHRAATLGVGAFAALVAMVLALLLVNPWRGEPHVAGYLVAVTAQDGTPVWQRHVPGLGGFLGGVRVQGGELLVTGAIVYQGCRGAEQTMRIDRSSGRVLHPDVQMVEGGEIAVESTSYQLSDDARVFTASRRDGKAVLQARDRASGRELWTHQLPGQQDRPFSGYLPRRPSRTYAVGTVSDGVVYLAYGVDASDCRSG